MGFNNISHLRNARRKMCPDAADEPSVITSRSGLCWLQKTQTVQDEKVDGEYGLIINGHSLVRRATVHLRTSLILNWT